MLIFQFFVHSGDQVLKKKLKQAKTIMVSGVIQLIISGFAFKVCVFLGYIRMQTQIQRNLNIKTNLATNEM